VPVRVSIEAGATFGWQRWTGDRGANIGLDRYGASAPGGQNMAKLGFTPERVVETVRALLK
jgi:transketolase